MSSIKVILVFFSFPAEKIEPIAVKQRRRKSAEEGPKTPREDTKEDGLAVQ
jgi:hypothetical protein